MEVVTLALSFVAAATGTWAVYLMMAYRREDNRKERLPLVRKLMEFQNSINISLLELRQQEQSYEAFTPEQKAIAQGRVSFHPRLWQIVALTEAEQNTLLLLGEFKFHGKPFRFTLLFSLLEAWFTSQQIAFDRFNVPLRLFSLPQAIHLETELEQILAGLADAIKRLSD